MNSATRASGPRVSPEWDTPAFLLSDAAAAAEVKTNILKAWLDREVVPLGPTDRQALGRGSGRVFTLRRVVSIAIMAELTRMGVKPSKAALVAYVVTDNNATVGEVELSLPKAMDGGYLIVSPGDEVHFDFVPAGSKIALASIMEARSSITAVSFAALFDRIFHALQRRGKWPQ